jgi:hypothetical protein
MTDEIRRRYAELLEDPSLLDSAVAVGHDLAVPIGGRRRGGFVCVDGEEGAAAAIAVLSGHPGFPNLRVVLSDDPEVWDNVRWGDDEPPVPQLDASAVEWARSDMAAGHLYGYREKAIREFLVRQWGKRAAVEATA